MRNTTTFAFALGLVWSATAAAQHAEHAAQAQPAEHAQHTEHAPPVEPPVDAPLAHAMNDDPLNKLVLLDRLEWQDASGSDASVWDLDTWVGHDLGKLWIRSAGEQRDGNTERAELELLWGKAFARWWDVVAGARGDFAPGEDQTWAAVGVRGMAPYRFDVEATTYLGDGGRTALRVETQYAVLITQRWILTPHFEVNWHGQSDPARGIGAGLTDAELGLRLRFELRREIAPYIGVVHERKHGRTADLAVAAGTEVEDSRLVAGIRLWF